MVPSSVFTDTGTFTGKRCLARRSDFVSLVAIASSRVDSREFARLYPKLLCGNGSKQIFRCVPLVLKCAAKTGRLVSRWVSLAVSLRVCGRRICRQSLARCRNHHCLIDGG